MKMHRYQILILSVFLMFSNVCAAASESLINEQAETICSGYTMVRHLDFESQKLPDGTEEWLNALSSLAGDMQVDLRFADNMDGSFASTAVYLHDATVFDWTAQIRGGLYCEQSSYLDGETIAIDDESFLPFIVQLLANGGTSGDVLPGFLSKAFEWMISKEGNFLSIDIDYSNALEEWEGTLNWEPVEVPQLLLPGVEAETAEGIEWDRQGILETVQRQWESAREFGDLDEPAEMFDPTPIALAADIIEDLPQLLQMYLPEDALLRFLHIGHHELGIICKRLEYSDSERMISLEWLTGQEINAVSIACACTNNASGTLTYVRQLNTGNNADLSPSADCIAITGEWLDTEGFDYRFEATWDLAKSEKRDQSLNEWELRIQFEKGNSLLFRIVGSGTEKANGSGADQKTNGTSEWRLTGWGLTDCHVLTVHKKDEFEKTVYPIDTTQEGIFYPGRADLEEINTWINKRSEASVSALLSMIALIPPETASYLLTLIH